MRKLPLIAALLILCATASATPEWLVRTYVNYGLAGVLATALLINVFPYCAAQLAAYYWLREKWSIKARQTAAIAAAACTMFFLMYVAPGLVYNYSVFFGFLVSLPFAFILEALAIYVLDMQQGAIKALKIAAALGICGGLFGGIVIFAAFGDDNANLIGVDPKIAQSENYWKNMRPFAIIEHSMGAGGVSLVVENFDSEARKIKSISLKNLQTGDTSLFAPEGDGALLAPGEVKIFYNISLDGCRSPGYLYDDDISIAYSKPGSNRLFDEIGEKALVGRCH